MYATKGDLRREYIFIRQFDDVVLCAAAQKFCIPKHCFYRNYRPWIPDVDRRLLFVSQLDVVIHQEDQVGWSWNSFRLYLLSLIHI